jgi:hypothetical protein
MGEVFTNGRFSTAKDSDGLSARNLGYSYGHLVIFAPSSQGREESARNILGHWRIFWFNQPITTFCLAPISRGQQPTYQWIDHIQLQPLPCVNCDPGVALHVHLP